MILFKKLSEEENKFVMSEYRKLNIADNEIMYEDFKIVVSIKAYIKRIANGADVNHIIVHNKIVTLFNIFGDRASRRLLAKEIHIKYHGIVKAFLVRINKLEKFDEFSLIIVNDTTLQKLNEVMGGRN